MGDSIETKNEKILDIQDLNISFKGTLGTVRAVNGVSLELKRGEILGIVGESGCGKSVTALSVLRLVPTPPGRIDGGQLLLKTDGKMVDVTKLDPRGRDIRRIRGKDVTMIFQEPMRSLHPMHTIGGQITEGLLEHENITKNEAMQKAVDLLARVGLPHPESLVKDYPHHLSGGMRQRAMIAIALACKPELLIADEPTTALDVTIQAQILELIKELRDEVGMAVMLITHDLAVIAETTENVAVMYSGRVVEYTDVESLFEEPLHPYTQGLLDSIPTLVSEPKTRLKSLGGAVPELFEVPQECVFADRCEHVFDRCRAESPPNIEVKPGHNVECWLYVEGAKNE